MEVARTAVGLCSSARQLPDVVDGEVARREFGVVAAERADGSGTGARSLPASPLTVLSSVPTGAAGEADGEAVPCGLGDPAIAEVAVKGVWPAEGPLSEGSRNVAVAPRPRGRVPPRRGRRAGAGCRAWPAREVPPALAEVVPAPATAAARSTRFRLAVRWRQVPYQHARRWPNRDQGQGAGQGRPDRGPPDRCPPRAGQRRTRRSPGTGHRGIWPSRGRAPDPRQRVLVGTPVQPLAGDLLGGGVVRGAEELAGACQPGRGHDALAQPEV